MALLHLAVRLVFWSAVLLAAYVLVATVISLLLAALGQPIGGQ